MPPALDWLVVGDVALEVDETGRSGTPILGGAAARLAAHGAALGLRVALVAKVGDDDAGARAKEHLNRLRVDLRWLRTATGMRTTIWHEVPDRPESRRIERGADLALRLDEVPAVASTPARLTIVSGFSLSVEPARAAAIGALRGARARGGRGALQLEAAPVWWTNARITRRVLELALASAGSVALNRADARALFGADARLADVAREIAAAGPRLVYLDDGEGGALLLEGARLHTIPAVRDSAPPHDRFAGPAAFWAGLARGMVPRRAAQTAVRHAQSVRRAGAPRQPIHM